MLIPGSAFEREKTDSVKIILRNDKSLKSHHEFYPAEAAQGKPRAQKEHNMPLRIPPLEITGGFELIWNYQHFNQVSFLSRLILAQGHTHTHVYCALHKQKRGLPTG